ncbi:MAG: hypothetical protein ABJA70_12455, partial [Chryseolinea sp.]
ACESLFNNISRSIHNSDFYSFNFKIIGGSDTDLLIGVIGVWINIDDASCLAGPPVDQFLLSYGDGNSAHLAEQLSSFGFIRISPWPVSHSLLVELKST